MPASAAAETMESGIVNGDESVRPYVMFSPMVMGKSVGDCGTYAMSERYVFVWSEGSVWLPIVITPDFGE